MPPQLAAENSGVSMSSNFGSRALVVVVDQAVAQRVAVAVGAVLLQLARRTAFGGPATGSPVTTLLAPRSPTPCCTAVTWRGYQLE